MSGDLAREDGARAFRTELSRLASTLVMPNAAPGAPRTLGDMGLALNRDGTFRVDKLSRSVSRTGDPRSLGGSIARYNALKTKTTEDLSKLAEKQEVLRANLVRRFASSDSRVSTSKSTLSFLQNQIDAWSARG